MRLFLFCVFDSASGVYDRPWAARSEGEALRSFQDISCDADHPIGKHPEHFNLYRVGTYDDNTGSIVPEVPVCVGKAADLVAASRKVLTPSGNGAVSDAVRGALTGFHKEVLLEDSDNA